MLECVFSGFFWYWGLTLSFKANCFPQIDGGLCLAGCHVVARTDTELSSGMHQSSLVKFQGGEVVVKFDVFSHCYTVCFSCLHARNDPLC